MSTETSATRMAYGDGMLASGGDASVRLPPLRQDPRTEAPTDGALLARLKGEWSAQDNVMRARDLSIEEVVSFLCNRQWIQYNDITGRHYDITEWMTEEEKRWRQRPVVNLMLPWFLLTHARMTENPPIITMVPGPDQKDAQLAEILDVLCKLTWKQAGMTDVIDRLYAWMIASGEVYWMSRIDLTKGEFRPRIGKTRVELLAPDGTPIPGPDGSGEIEAEGVPLDENYMPMAVMDAETGQLIPTGEPFYDREGQIVVDVLPAMCVRGAFGGNTPWHEKPWHMTVGYYTPEHVWDTWGVEVAADAEGSVGVDASIEALLFGHGHFTPNDRTFLAQGGAAEGAKRNLVKVYQRWEKPSMRDPQLRQTPTNPGGRYTVFTETRVLVDGSRPVAFPYTSPIRKGEFVRIPGRPAGTTVAVSLLGPQRTYNKRRAQLGEHAALTANPKAVIDQTSGIEEGQWTNEPGTAIVATMRPNVDPVRWLSPPSLGASVLEDASMAREEMEYIGSTKGTGGEPLSPDESGEARKERRFDSDRYVGPTQRRITEEMGRMYEDWRALLPVIYDEARVVRDAGEDNVFRSVLVMPELFTTGTVNVSPDLESMMPESRGERQSRFYQLWKEGALGDPADPEVRTRFLEMSRFPHLSRASRFGSVDAQTADQENGALLVGEPVPVLPFYDHAEHLRMHNRFRKTREYLKVLPEIRMAFDLHCQQHEFLLAEQQMAAQMEAMAMQGGAPPGGGGGPRPSPGNAQAEAFGTPPSGMNPPPPSPPSQGQPGRLPPRVIGNTASMPAGMGL